jgi:hypothetical protein
LPAADYVLLAAPAMVNSRDPVALSQILIGAEDILNHAEIALQYTVLVHELALEIEAVSNGGLTLDHTFVQGDMNVVVDVVIKAMDVRANPRFLEG